MLYCALYTAVPKRLKKGKEEARGRIRQVLGGTSLLNPGCGRGAHPSQAALGPTPIRGDSGGSQYSSFKTPPVMVQAEILSRREVQRDPPTRENWRRHARNLRFLRLESKPCTTHPKEVAHGRGLVRTAQDPVILMRYFFT